MSRAYFYAVLLFLALAVTSACSPSCEECENNFSLHFMFVDESGEEILNDGKIKLTDKLRNEFAIERAESESDTSFVVNLVQSSADIPEPDTIIFFYENAIIDSATVKFGFQRDNDCCVNPRVVESITLHNLNSAKLIRREYNIYRITVE